MKSQPYIADRTHPSGPAVLLRDPDRPTIIISRVLIAEEMSDPEQVAAALNRAFEDGRKARQLEIEQVLGIEP